MIDLFDTTSIQDSPEHWDALASRITSHVARNATTLDWLAHSRAGFIAACFTVAASLALLMSSSDPLSPRDASLAWMTALTPADDVAQAMLARQAPPAIESLLFPRRSETR
jgi:hypothetical protein